MGSPQLTNPYPEDWSDRIVGPQARAFDGLPEGYVLEDPGEYHSKPAIDGDKFAGKLIEGIPEGFVLDEGPGAMGPQPHEGRQPGPVQPKSGLFLSQDDLGNVSPGAIPQFLKDSWEDIKKFMKQGDEQAAFRIAATLASGGFARGALSKGGAELGVFGGKLPSSWQVIEGGKTTVKQALDDLATNLATALKNPDMADLTVAKKSMETLQKHADDLAKEHVDTFPELAKMTKFDLDALGLTPDQYKMRVLQFIDKKIQQGRQETFKVLSGGRDPNKPITVDNIVGWLKEAGVQNVKVESKGSWDTTYITFEAGGFHHAQVRVSLDGHIARHTRKNLVDAAGSKNWQELIDAIMQKFKLQ